MTNLLKLRTITVLTIVASAIPLIACAAMNPKDGMVRESKECINLRGEEPSIIIRKSGNWIVCDQYGREVVPKADFMLPMEAKRIEHLEGITILEAIGSHYLLVCGAGGCREYPLPHK